MTFFVFSVFPAPDSPLKKETQYMDRFRISQGSQWITASTTSLFLSSDGTILLANIYTDIYQWGKLIKTVSNDQEIQNSWQKTKLRHDPTITETERNLRAEDGLILAI